MLGVGEKAAEDTDAVGSDCEDGLDFLAAGASKKNIVMDVVELMGYQAASMGVKICHYSFQCFCFTPSGGQAGVLSYNAHLCGYTSSLFLSTRYKGLSKAGQTTLMRVPQAVLR